MRFFKRKPKKKNKEYSRKEWILLLIEAGICYVGADYYGFKLIELEQKGLSGDLTFLIHGLVFVFFIATSFGNIWDIYKYGRLMLKKR